MLDLVSRLSRFSRHLGYLYALTFLYADLKLKNWFFEKFSVEQVLFFRVDNHQDISANYFSKLVPLVVWDVPAILRNKEMALLVCDRFLPFFLLGLIFLFSKKRVIIADKDLWKASDAIFLASAFKGCDSKYFDRSIMLEKSSSSFSSFVAEVGILKKRSIELMLTGPSIGELKNRGHRLSGSIKMGCNSVVMDDDLWVQIDGLDVLCFADPVFHFSYNDYAVSFREKVVERFLRKAFFIVVPAEYVGTMKDRDIFGHHLIGLPSLREMSVEMDADRFGVPPTGNILTMMMLPLAASLDLPIGIWGADGRATGESYFWRHNEATQISEKMSAVFNAHPSFLADYDIDEYYLRHCETVENFIKEIEGAGGEVFSRTPSLIPALRDRFRPYRSASLLKNDV